MTANSTRDRLSVRLTAADQMHMTAIADHLGANRKYLDRTEVIRFALKASAEAIAEKTRNEAKER